MIRILGHPSFERLSGYADGELVGRRRDRVASHLAGCDRCRDTVRFIRELGRAARSLPAPEPPADAVPRFLARRAAGERVLLPLSDPVALEARPRRTLPAVAAVAALLVAGTLLLLPVPRLRADRSRLAFEPERPTLGAHVDVRYESGALFRSQSTLVLRARYRYTSGAERTLEVARLSRDDDGAFRGGFTLPDSVVYAVFAVEDTAASRVDSNTRRLWELIVHDRNGRPLFDALRERTNDLVGRNWQAAYETVRSVTELYPERAWGWYTLFWLDGELSAGTANDSLVRAHRDRLARLDRLALVGDPDDDDVAYLALYAAMLQEQDVLRRWRERLTLNSPDHPVAVQIGLLDLRRDRDSMERLERQWNSSSRGHRELAAAGFRLAVGGDDPDAAFRWADRYVDVAPWNVAPVARHLTASFGDDRRLLPWLERSLRRVLHGTLRPRALDEDQERHRELLAVAAAPLRQVLAPALIAAGRTDEGLEQLIAAADAGWAPDAIHAAAQALAKRGEFDLAAEYLARTVVDPAADPQLIAGAHALGRTWVGEVKWKDSMDRARARLSAYVHRRAVYRTLPGDLEWLDASGWSRELRDSLQGEITLVAFWSPLCAPSIAALPQLEATARVLGRHGIRTVAVAIGEPSPELVHRIAETVPSAAARFDPQGKVARAFDQWGTPEFFIVDGEGVIRFQYTTLAEAVRQAVLVKTSAGRPLVAP